MPPEPPYRLSATHECALESLKEKARRDLAALDYPNIDWLPQVKTAAGEHVYDVIIVGAGQGGLAVGLALTRERVRNILLLDSASAGHEGPWITFARMRTLRTPKYLTGPDLGLPDLGFPAWYSAKYEHPDWASVERIPRAMWMDYLNWFRTVVELPILNETEVERIAPHETGLLEVACATATGRDMLLARKVVMANGLEGSGEWYVPKELTAGLPRDCWAHTADDIDFGTFAGRRVGVLGVGASAIDNAAEALEHGATHVDIFCRRPELPAGERRQWLENVGFLRHFADLDDALRWRAIRHLCEAGTPPPPWSLDRVTSAANCRIRPGEPWLSTRMSGDAVIVETRAGEDAFDFLIFGTGILVDLDLRRELQAYKGQIATWGDRYTPPPEDACPPLAKYPYLGSGFQLTELAFGSAPSLKNIHIFNWGATASMGVSASSITGMKFGVSRLVAGITHDFYAEFAAEHIDAFPYWAADSRVLD